jgi:hypothetical protein
MEEETKTEIPEEFKTIQSTVEWLIREELRQLEEKRAALKVRLTQKYEEILCAYKASHKILT